MKNSSTWRSIWPASRSTHAQAEDAVTRLNETRQERAGALMDVNQGLEAFRYSVSHDLRAPLRHLDGFTDVLIDDLLAFSQIGRAEFSRRSVSLQKLLEEVLRDVQSDVQGRQIAWNIGALPDVVGDAVMLRLVLANLLANALKYTRDRHSTVRPRRGP